MSGTHPTLTWPDRDDHRLRQPTALISDDLASGRVERSNIEAPPRLLAIGRVGWPALRQSSSANDHPQECGEADMLEYRPRRTSSAEGSRQKPANPWPLPKALNESGRLSTGMCIYHIQNGSNSPGYCAPRIITNCPRANCGRPPLQGARRLSCRRRAMNSMASDRDVSLRRRCRSATHTLNRRCHARSGSVLRRPA
jgi:hypothetical protein